MKMIGIDYINEFILQVSQSISIYLIIAVVLSILGITVNILGLKRKYGVEAGLIYLSIILFSAYMVIALLSALMGGLTLILYYTSFMIAASIPAFTAVAIMNKYAGNRMEVNSRPFLVYIIVLLFLLMITLFTYPGKTLSLAGESIGLTIVSFETRIIYSLILYPTVVILSLVPIISMFKIGVKKAPLLISLGSLSLIISLVSMELGFITLTDIFLLVTALLYIIGFNDYLKGLK